MVFPLIWVGLAVLVLGFIALLPPHGVATGWAAMPLMLIGIGLLIAGGFIAGTSALIDFMVQYWWITFPVLFTVLGAFLFNLFFKEVK